METLPTPPPGPRFLTLDQVADELQVGRPEVYALVRDRSLVAVKIGGRGQWRVERCRLEQYIDGLYRQAERFSPTDLLAPPVADCERDDGYPPSSQLSGS